jgi:hypothetical protein
LKGWQGRGCMYSLCSIINGKFNHVSSADENKKIIAEPSFKNYKKILYLFISRRLRSYTCLKKL